MMVLVAAAAVLAVGRDVLARTGRRGLERARREAHDGGGVENGRRGVHVLVRAHLFAETRPTVAEPHLHPGLRQLGPEQLQ